MRKNLITKDYRNTYKSGAANMIEVRNFGSSKAMYVEDTLLISGDMVKNFISEPIISQKISNDESKKNPTWNSDIRYTDMLNKYLYDKIVLPPNDFNDIKIQDTHDGNINNAINSYIKENILKMYKLESVYLWVDYNLLINNKVTKGSNTYTLLMNKPIFDSSVKPITDAYNKSEKLNLTYNKDTVTIAFKQLQDAMQYMYFYNYEFKFVRI